MLLTREKFLALSAAIDNLEDLKSFKRMIAKSNSISFQDCHIHKEEGLLNAAKAGALQYLDGQIMQLQSEMWDKYQYDDVEWDKK